MSKLIVLHVIVTICYNNSQFFTIHFSMKKSNQYKKVGLFKALTTTLCK